MATGSTPPLHDMVKPLSWLLGKWRCEDGFGHYPTIQDFKFIREMEFFHVGQPNIQYNMYAWRPDNKTPMERETGFIRVKPKTNQIAIISAHNIGVSIIEEGEFKDKEITVESHTIGRISFGKEPVTHKLKRTFKMVGDELEQIMYMETSKTPMTEHLRMRYKRV